MNRGFRFFNRFGRDFKTIVSTGLATSTFLATLNYHNSFSEGSNGANNIGESYLVYQPSFGLASTNSSRMNKNEDDEQLDMTLIGGTAHSSFANEISRLIKVPIADSSLSRFSDGEISVKILSHMRGRDVFIVQSCAAPVNDSIMELLLTVSCARRAGASRIIAVIPYFGYKHHRRWSPISSRKNSRFLSSGAMDFAKMLQEMGVDRVVAVDLQRSGQGHEACFFDNQVPLETIVTTELFVDYIAKNLALQECVKKAKKYQEGLIKYFPDKEVRVAAFLPQDSSSGPTDTTTLALMGHPTVKDCDVIIVDDMIDTGGTVTNISNKLHLEGARNIYLCASHGLFSNNAMKLIDSSPIKQVIVSNSLPIPTGAPRSTKVVQLSVAPLVAHVILTEHLRGKTTEIEEFQLEE
eukprot:gene34874-45128_t